jgi:hypothetical protein
MPKTRSVQIISPTFGLTRNEPLLAMIGKGLIFA